MLRFPSPFSPSAPGGAAVIILGFGPLLTRATSMMEAPTGFLHVCRARHDGFTRQCCDTHYTFCFEPGNLKIEAEDRPGTLEVSEMRLLIVEDDAKPWGFVANDSRETEAVDNCLNGEDGLAMTTGNNYDVAIVDRMQPGLDGLALAPEIRRGDVATPVLILSAEGSVVADRVRDRQTGGDDHLAKPFPFAEIQALIRRNAHVTGPTTSSVGDITLDLPDRLPGTE